MDHSHLEINWAGQSFQLLPDKALYWRERSTLIFSDVHLGKAQDFQRAGIPIPATIHDDDLARMGKLLREFDPARVFVLGDFVHSHRSNLAELTANFREMKSQFRAQWILTVGNHDRALPQRFKDWNFSGLVDEIFESGIRFCHGHHGPKGPAINGHMHPVFRFGKGADRLRLPCFYLRSDNFILPSFGSFTGGYEIQPEPSERVFVVAQDHVVEYRRR